MSNAAPVHPTALRFKRLLLTGANGNLGKELRPRLKHYCEVLRLSHRSPIGEPRAGEEIVRRQLSVPPTLTVRPGFPVRVIVHRDLVLEPYGG